MGKKSSAPAPLPDPAIGQAAMQNAAIAQQWLDFSKQQFTAGEARQDVMDKLTGRVAESALATQTQADKWAAEDRQIQSDYRKKFDGWSDQDRALGRNTMAELDGLGKTALANAEKYEKTFGAEAQRQSDFGIEEQGRYKSMFRPVQDRLVKDAMTWDSAERIDAETAKAKADVVTNAAQQQEANRRSMASMGVNPNSGRFAGVDRAGSTATALAAAGAQNVARDNIRQQGIALRGQAAQLGQQVLANGQQASQMGMQASAAGQTARMNGISTAMQAKNMGLAAAGVGNTSASLGMGNQGAGYQGLGLGVTAGNAAVGATQAGNANFYQNNGVMGQGFTGAMQGYANQGNILNNLHGNQLNAWSAGEQAKGQASAGIGSMIGTLGGAAIKAGMFSSKEYKEGKRPVEGALPALKGLAIEAWKYKDGIADGGEHIGPYAEDFHAATGKGDGKTIPIVDAIGVTMKAVQELDQKVEKLTTKKGVKR